MLDKIYRKEIEDVYSTSIIQQTAFWSEVKRKLGSDSLALDFRVSEKSGEISTSTTGDVLVILKKIDRNHSYAYVPYGPEFEPGEDSKGIFLEELSEVMRSFLPQDCIMIRYDLSWESFWAREEDFYVDGNWAGPPETSLQEIRFNFSTVNWNFSKALTNNLPSNTIYINLSKSDDELLKSMKPKTRYNIGLSSKNDVKVRTTGIKDLGIWYKLYRETASRNNFYLHDINYFSTILSVDAGKTNSPAEAILLIAEKDNIPLSAMFLVISGSRSTYMYGASSTENRNLMGSYALQWKAINISKAMGCTEYDMFGVSPKADPCHPMYGLYRFKTGFGGSMFHTLGCWDYPLNNEAYNAFKAVELKSKGFHLN